jgi:hypothetical protein
VTASIYIFIAKRASAYTSMKSKNKRIIVRPDVDVEYSTIRQRLIAYIVWLKFVILKSRLTINFTYGQYVATKRKYLIIPRYHFIKHKSQSQRARATD